jgi:hypothetical protein
MKQILRTASIDRLIPLLIAAVVVLTFYPTLFTFFVDDDFRLLWFAQKSGLKFSDVLVYDLNLPVGVFFRPFALTVFLSLESVFGIHAFYYHVVSLFLHCINALLVYVLTKLISRGTENRSSAIIAAMIFAVHPRVLDVVALINSLPDLLCTLLMLASLILFLRQLDHWTYLNAISSGLTFALALLSKEIAVVMPALLAYVYFLRRKDLESRIVKRQMLLIVSVELAYFVFRYASVHQLGIGASGYANYTFIHLFSFFIKGMLAFLFPAQVVSLLPQVGFYATAAIFALFALLILIGAFISRRHPAAHSSRLLLPATAIGCGFICLAPPSFYDFALRTMQENRFLYLPLAFFSMGIAGFICESFRRTSSRTTVVLIYLVALAVASRVEASTIVPKEAVVQSLFNEMRQLRGSLLAADTLIILGSPCLCKGVPIRLPKEGVALAVALPESYDSLDETGERWYRFLRKTTIVGEIMLNDLTEEYPVDWNITGDTLWGRMKNRLDSFIHRPGTREIKIGRANIGIFEEDTLRRTFQQISISPLSTFGRGTVLLSCGIGRARVLNLDTGDSSPVQKSPADNRSKFSPARFHDH